MNNPTVSIKWEEPPAPKRGKARAEHWDLIAQALRDNPGRWALIAENKPTSHASSLRKRGAFAFRFVKSKTGYRKGFNDIYARFVGDSND